MNIGNAALPCIHSTLTQAQTTWSSYSKTTSSFSKSAPASGDRITDALRKVSLVNDNVRILAQISESLCDPCAQHRYALAVSGPRNRSSTDGKIDKSSPGSAGKSTEMMLLCVLIVNSPEMDHAGMSMGAGIEHMLTASQILGASEDTWIREIVWVDPIAKITSMVSINMSLSEYV